MNKLTQTLKPVKELPLPLAVIYLGITVTYDYLPTLLRIYFKP